METENNLINRKSENKKISNVSELRREDSKGNKRADRNNFNGNRNLINKFESRREASRDTDTKFKINEKESRKLYNNSFKRTGFNIFRFDLKFIFMLLMIVMMLQGVLSLGITPGRTSYDYEAGIEKEVPLSILNTEHKNMQVLVMVQGELNDSITLFDNILDFMPSEESKPIKYKIKFPERIAKEPGLHTAEIIVIEIPKATASGTFVGATVGVVSQLYVYVPCPGKCIDAELNVLDAENNATATFIVPVINRGKLGIGQARAVIDIYTGLNEKIATIETDSLEIGAGSRTELSAKWPVSVNSGNYIAKISVFYDGETKSFEKQFSIGANMLSIESILVNNFQLGEIAKLQILVENKWNEEIKEVYGNLIVYNHEEQVMADVKSATESVPALSKKELIAYWDTVGVDEGEYNGKLYVKYGKKSSDKNLILKISQDNLEIFGVGYAIRPKGGKGTNMVTILTILVVLLLIVNLAWFVFYKRIMMKRKKK